MAVPNIGEGDGTVESLHMDVGFVDIAEFHNCAGAFQCDISVQLFRPQSAGIRV